MEVFLIVFFVLLSQFYPKISSFHPYNGFVPTQMYVTTKTKIVEIKPELCTVTSEILQ